jgi:drug/metabolite transporter (DMT)-like permease
MDPFSNKGEYNSLGMASAFIAGWVLAFWVLWAKKSEQLEEVTPASCLTGYSFFTSLFLVVIYFLESEFIQSGWLGGFSPASWSNAALEISSISILAYLVPGFLFFWGIGGVAASVAGILLMLEPVSATFLAAVWFHEPITLNIWIVGALILLANGLVLRKRN